MSAESLKMLTASPISVPIALTDMGIDLIIVAPYRASLRTLLAPLLQVEEHEVLRASSSLGNK